MKIFFFRRKEFFVAAASIFTGVAILIAYFQSGPNADTYAYAESVYAKWEASPQDEELYSRMKEALRKAPPLQKKYQAAMAQKLLNSGHLSEAIPLANQSLHRIKEDTPFHAAFALNTLMIEEGLYQDALEKAVQLKEQMGNELDLKVFSGDRLVGGALLYTHNLLRIACLQQQLKNSPGETAAWEEFEGFLKPKTPIFDLVLGSFSKEKIDLNTYIAERKKQR